MSQAGPSSVVAAGVIESAQPMRHVPLQNSVCVLCRFPIWKDEKIGAVVGNCELSSYSAFTLGFSFPEYGYPFKYTAVHERGGIQYWKLCRYHPCALCRRGQDAALYHVDCYQMVSKHHKPLRLWDIWMISLWSQPTPGSQYLVWSNFSTSFPTNIPASVDGLAYFLSRMPEELREAMVRQCTRSQYLRLLMSLHRRNLYGPLLDDHHIERELSFEEVISWSRNRGFQLGQAKHDWVRIRLDDYGVAELTPFDNELDTAVPEPAHNKRYIVESIKALKDSRILVKGRFLRIKANRPLQIWETPRPSFTENVVWYDKKNLPVFVRSIALEGLRGVTAFCRKGSIHWLHPHYAGEEQTDAPPPSQECFDPSERGTFTPMYFPLAQGEVVESIWVRYRGFRKIRNEITPILVTNFGRPLFLGKYEHPAHAGVTFGPVQLTLGRHLLLPCHNPTFSDANFGILKRPNADESMMMVPQNLTRALLSPLQVEDALYLSVAPFASIREMTLFSRIHPSDGTRQYIGIIIQYDDSAFESLGSCYGWPDAQVIVNPTKIQAYHEDGYMNLRFSPANEWRFEVLDKYQTHQVTDGDTLLWWYDDRGLRMIEADTRAQPH